MNTKQENRLNMYLAVNLFLLPNLERLASLPNFTTSLNAFQNFIALIQSAIEKQVFDKSGVAKSKQELKQNLALLAGDNARKLYAYALFINDRVLSTEMQITQNKLEKKSDTMLMKSAEGIFNRVALYLNDLTPYGITADSQLLLRNAIDDFTESMPKPRLNSTESKLITRQMAEYFIGAEKWLEQLDALIEILRNSEPDIYNSYLQARKTVDYGTRSNAVRGIIVDAITKIGLKGVTINFVIANEKSLQPALVKKTAAKGGFNIKSLAEGIYQIKLSKVGYVDQVITITVNKGELCKVNVEMSRI
jgi:hypothetical protein